MIGINMLQLCVPTSKARMPLWSHPDSGEVVIKSLAGSGAVQRVEVVGAPGALPFRQDNDGLRVAVPEGVSHDYGLALKISGERLT